MPHKIILIKCDYNLNYDAHYDVIFIHHSLTSSILIKKKKQKKKLLNILLSETLKCTLPWRQEANFHKHTHTQRKEAKLYFYLMWVFCCILLAACVKVSCVASVGPSSKIQLLLPTFHELHTLYIRRELTRTVTWNLCQTLNCW